MRELREIRNIVVKLVEEFNSICLRRGAMPIILNYDSDIPKKEEGNKVIPGFACTEDARNFLKELGFKETDPAHFINGDKIAIITGSNSDYIITITSL